MTSNDLEYLKGWFAEYAKSFYSEDKEDQKNILVKIKHTYNVCNNIVAIAQGLDLSDQDVRLAETVALFHDVGRFSQYARYKTFKDAVSENHGLLGSQILAERHALNDLSKNEQEVVIKTVRFHNAYTIPAEVDEKIKFYLRLIRDADKVDIYRVFIEYYESPEIERASAIAFGLPDIPEYSPEMLVCLNEKRIASYQGLKTENDFRLLKLSWVYSLNYDVSLMLLRERGYIDNVCRKLPHTDEIRVAIEKLQEYISGRLSHGDAQ